MPFLLGLALLAGSEATLAAGGSISAGKDLGVANDGDLHLTIPIDAPVGTGGFSPPLSLRYSSASGDGPFGVGWSLPLGEVRRTTRFGVPAYDATDQFELDKNLLIWNPAQSHYRTQRESLTEARFYSTGNYWEATHANGTRARFGKSASARVNHASGATFRWLLSELEDVHGNTIRFEYDDTLDPGSRYPKDIIYSFRPGATTAVGGVERKISFLWEARPDPVTDYEGGVASTLSYRINEIQSTVYLPGQGTRLWRRRVLTYGSSGYDTGRSRIVSTRLFGDGGTAALPAQTFSYTKPNIGSGASSQWATAGWTVPDVLGDAAGDRGYQVGDVNGDGLPDLLRAHRDAAGAIARAVYLNNGSGWNATPDSAWTAALTNLTFAGKRFQMSTAAGTVLCAPSTAAVTYPVLLSDGADWTPSGWNPPIRARLVDLDADGRVDIALSYAVGAGTYWNNCGSLGAGVHTTGTLDTVRVVLRNTSAGGGPVGWALDAALAAGLPPFYEIGWIAQQAQSEPGVPPYYVPGPPADGRVRCFANPPNIGDPGIHGCLVFSDNGATFAELNGDGHADILANGAWINGSWGTTGWAGGFAASPAWTPPVSLAAAFGVRAVDLNGDDLVDLVDCND